jgi:hypothetical protein
MYYSFIAGTFVALGANLLTGHLQKDGALGLREGLSPLCFGLASLYWQMVAMSVERLRSTAALSQPPDVRSLRTAMYEQQHLSDAAKSALRRFGLALLLSAGGIITI